MLVDMHVHSKYSPDSNMEIKDIVKQGKKQGLSAVAITDHGTWEGGFKGEEFKDESFSIIPGAEINTNLGEVIGYFLQGEIKYRDFYDVMDQMKEQDALIAVPHPFDTFRLNRVKEIEKLYEKFHAMEIFNSRCILSSFNVKAYEFAKEHNMGITAGSDAHTLAEIGKGGVMVESIEDLRKNKIKDIFGQRIGLPGLVKGKMTRMMGGK